MKKKLSLFAILFCLTPSHAVGGDAFVSGVVADVVGDALVMNIGSRAGLKPGAHLRVRRAIREIKDPATGKVVRRVEDPVGDVIISEVEEYSSAGKFKGTMPAKVGDLVTSAQ